MPYDAEAPATIKEQLERAKDAMRTRGHARYKIEGPDGSVCTWGAIAIGATGDPHARVNGHLGRDTPAHAAVIRQLMQKGASAGICYWNNATGRTADDVIALFDRTIASL